MPAREQRILPTGGCRRDCSARGPIIWILRLAAYLVVLLATANGTTLGQTAKPERSEFIPLLEEAEEEENVEPPNRLSPLMPDIQFENEPPAPLVESIPPGPGYPHEESFARPQDHIGTAPMESMGGIWGDPDRDGMVPVGAAPEAGPDSHVTASPPPLCAYPDAAHRRELAISPFSAGWFMGAMTGSPLITNWMGAGHGFLGGYRFGWDFDQYWGTEVRFSFASLKMWDSRAARAAQRAADDAAGLAPDDPWRNRYDARRDANVGMFDLNLLYYPWGDTAWRPYFRLGLGTVRIQCQDRLGTDYDSTVVGIPWGIGGEVQVFEWLALRGEIADNVAIHAGSSFNTQHNFSFTFGMEVRFGGSRTAYWPLEPGHPLLVGGDRRKRPPLP